MRFDSIAPLASLIHLRAPIILAESSSWSLRCDCFLLAEARLRFRPVAQTRTASRGYAIGIQSIFIDTWNVRAAMPRISGVLYIRIHGGQGSFLADSTTLPSCDNNSGVFTCAYNSRMAWNQISILFSTSISCSTPSLTPHEPRLILLSTSVFLIWTP